MILARLFSPDGIAELTLEREQTEVRLAVDQEIRVYHLAAPGRGVVRHARVRDYFFERIDDE